MNDSNDFDIGAYEQDKAAAKEAHVLCRIAMEALREAAPGLNSELAKAQMLEMADIIEAGLHDTGNVGLDHVQRELDDHAPDDNAEHRLTGVDYGVGR